MRTVVADHYQELSAFLASLPERMSRGEGEMIYEGRNQVARFRHDGLSLMVKRFKRVNVVQQLAYTFFCKTKAERAFRFANEFLQRSIDTPLPVAYMEERRYGLFSVGYFVSEEVQGTEISKLLREVEHYPDDLAEAVARQVLLMHSNGVLHGDLNLTNFLSTDPCLRTDQPCSVFNGYHFVMIDTNRSHFCDGMPTDEQCIQNMVRLTHRRDLYEDLVRRYARLRGWDAEAVAKKALELLERFEHRRFRL